MKKKKASYWEKYALRQLLKLERADIDSDLYILSEEERVALKGIRKKTYWRAGLAGALGVILLYAPFHLFADVLFPERTFWIPYLEQNITLRVEFLVYSLILVLIEIWYLTYLNIHAVVDIVEACGYSDSEEEEEENYTPLINVGLAKKQKELKTIGINPYDGLSKIGVWIFQTLIKMKAMISGFLWKLIVTKILGRYAFRFLVDFLGAPLYAGFNIFAARKVINETLVRVMAPPLILEFSNVLYDEFKDREDFKSILYSALHAISTSKRSFHYNHFLLASHLLNRFDVSIGEGTSYDRKFIKNIDELDSDIQQAVTKLIVFGIIIDGSLSIIEKRALKTMKDEGVLPYTLEEVQAFSKDFFEGRGLDQLISPEKK